MKKLSILLGLLAFAMVTFGQVALKSSINLPVDTVDNTETKYMTSGKIGGNVGALSITVTLDEISGTTAGTLSLEGSADGTNWFPFFQSYPDTVTYTATDVTNQSFRWAIPSNPRFGDLYVRVKYTGSGTMSTKIKGYYLARLE